MSPQVAELGGWRRFLPCRHQECGHLLHRSDPLGTGTWLPTGRGCRGREYRRSIHSGKGDSHLGLLRPPMDCIDRKGKELDSQIQADSSGLQDISQALPSPIRTSSLLGRSSTPPSVERLCCRCIDHSHTSSDSLCPEGSSSRLGMRRLSFQKLLLALAKEQRRCRCNPQHSHQPLDQRGSTFQRGRQYSQMQRLYLLHQGVDRYLLDRVDRMDKRRSLTQSSTCNYRN